MFGLPRWRDCPFPCEQSEKEFGQNGRVLSQKAQAIDPTPVVPYSEAKSISTEQTFARDTADGKQLKAALIRMTEKLAYQLRSKSQLTACVTVKIRYSGGKQEGMGCGQLSGEVVPTPVTGGHLVAPPGNFTG